MRITLFHFLIAIHLIAIAYGFYYYYAENVMLPFFSVWLWPFIADSPMSVLLATIALLGLVRSELFRYIAGVYMFKYGLWTAFVLAFHREYYFSPQIAVVTLFLFFLPHIGMALESILLVPKKFPLHYVAIALTWFLANDALDYFVEVTLVNGKVVQGMHTFIPLQGIETVASVAIALSLTGCIGIYIGQAKMRAMGKLVLTALGK